MEKTSSYIQTVKITGTDFRTATIVRPPAHLKVIRCTVILQPELGGYDSAYLSTEANQNELNTIRFSVSIENTNEVPPDPSRTFSPGLQSFVFDRLGIGYMTDNFFVSGSPGGAYFVFVWEGITQST
jgi:hypothetical protein